MNKTLTDKLRAGGRASKRVSPWGKWQYTPYGAPRTPPKPVECCGEPCRSAHVDGRQTFTCAICEKVIPA